MSLLFNVINKFLLCKISKFIFQFLFVCYFTGYFYLCVCSDYFISTIITMCVIFLEKYIVKE